jgi:AraC-like DNA-binding protein
MHYAPIQLLPSLHKPATALQPLTYNEYMPSEPLRAFVRCYWEITSAEKLREAALYKLVPDGCVDIFLDCVTDEGLFITTGAMTDALFLPFTGKVNFFGVRFFPAAITKLFPLSVKDVSQTMIPIQLVLGKTWNELSEKLFVAKTRTARIACMDAFLQATLIKQNKPTDSRLETALHCIYRHRGVLQMERDLTVIKAVTPQHLRRIFQEHIGTSPKRFARIVRFQHVLRELQTASAAGKKNDLNTLAYSFGYFDQAHFIHDFRSFFGESPKFA